MTYRSNEHSNQQTYAKRDTRLWHKDILLPALPPMPHRVNLHYTRHAADVSSADGVTMFQSITTARFEVIEVETKGYRPVKYVLRGAYNETDDVVLVLIPQNTGAWIVKTVWLNAKNDIHRTLNRSRYVRG